MVEIRFSSYALRSIIAWQSFGNTLLSLWALRVLIGEWCHWLVQRIGSIVKHYPNNIYFSTQWHRFESRSEEKCCFQDSILFQIGQPPIISPSIQDQNQTNDIPYTSQSAINLKTKNGQTLNQPSLQTTHASVSRCFCRFVIIEWMRSKWKRFCHPNRRQKVHDSKTRIKWINTQVK